MKILVFLIGLVSLSIVQAQPITNIKVGVDGLTCSACSRSVEMSLLKLDFIDSVSMSLENTEGTIHTKKMYPLDFNKIAKAVTDAGFSVRYVSADLNTEKIQISEKGCFTLAGINFQWVDYASNSTNKNFILVDSKFLSGKESNKWKKKLPTETCSDKATFHITNAGS